MSAAPVVGEQVDAVEPGRRPDGRSTAAASGLRPCTCRGRGAARHGRRGRPDLPRRVHWLPPGAAVPGTTVAGIGSPAPHDLARPVLPAGPGVAVAGKEEL